MSRDLIADSVELVMHAERFDALVGIAGCDKSEPGMMMAMARLNLPSVYLYGGTILPGTYGGRDITIQDVFEAVGAHAKGTIDDAELLGIERAACPTTGSCAGMYTANTMAAVGEAIGLSLPGAASPPAVDYRREVFARESGIRAAELVAAGRTAAAGHPHEGGLRERDHDRDGARGFDERRAPPPGDRSRGRRGPAARRLRPDLPGHAAPRRRPARREVRDERSRPGRRRARRDAGAARRRTAARRLPDGDREDAGREPRRAGPTRARRRHRARARRRDPPVGRDRDPPRQPRPRRRGREGRRRRGAHVRRGRAAVRLRAGRVRRRDVRRDRPRRRDRDPLRGPEGIAGDAGDARRHRRRRRRGSRQGRRADHRRPVLGRDEGLQRRAHRAGGVRRRAARRRSRRAIGSGSTPTRGRSSCSSTTRRCRRGAGRGWRRSRATRGAPSRSTRSSWAARITAP